MKAGRTACMGSGVKVRLLLVSDNGGRPRVLFKGSDKAYDIYQRTQRKAPPEGFHTVLQQANPDDNGFRTSFSDVTARAKKVIPPKVAD